jgi:cell division GTPase FtsZ
VQRVELQTISSALISIYGSKNMSMDDYNAINIFIHDQTNEECNLRIAVIFDDSLDENIMVSLLAVHRPLEEAVSPQGVKLYDRYSRVRHSEQSESGSSIYDDDEIDEVPSWLRKTL